jgi:serine/threonine-protein kinase
MVVLQVCRALAHAHAAGILHRDVKPENVMIRSDGVVKLMDFGISHMLDLERLTVTGQLLGSPAYMAPEHVEGRQLDFRTDVFAAGIVLYQLTVGKLPFEGRNPHEVLKRIAECKFVDPRQANPAIGNRLGRIILRAMAAEPADRFANVGEMVVALEEYLEESGVAADKVPAELARYFEAPVAYEQAFETRLIEHLTARGSKLLAANQRSAALDIFDRVLTMDPDNTKVLAILDGINRRRRIQQAGLGVAGLAVLAGCAYMIHRRNLPVDSDSIAPPPDHAVVWQPPPATHRAHDQVLQPPAEVPDATEPDVAAHVPNTPHNPPPLLDAGAVVPDAPMLDIVVRVSPRGSQIAFDNAPPLVAADGKVSQAFDHDVMIHATHPKCEEQQKLAHPGDKVMFDLQYKPATIVPRCDRPGTVDVRVDNKPARLGVEHLIPWPAHSTIESRRVVVEFITASGSLIKKQRVTPADRFEVTCD